MPTKMVVPEPDYIREQYPQVVPFCYLLIGGEYNGCYLHVVQMLYTCALMVSTEQGPITRWCYRTRQEAAYAAGQWKGEGDPPGEWITQKPEQRLGPGVPANFMYSE